MRLRTTMFALFSWIALSVGTVAQGGIISELVPVPADIDGSGNGKLDLRMFTFSGSEIGNVEGIFNGDNGNNTLPKGEGNEDISSFMESYVTTAGDLKAFYTLNFPGKPINEIVLFLDLDETGEEAQATNTLAILDIVKNPTSIHGLTISPFPADVSSKEQAAINQIYEDGELIAQLLGGDPVNLPTTNQGAGFPDYAIFTGINPFSLSDTDILLFNISMAKLNNGAEEIYLSGKFSASDIRPNPVPEPGSMVLLLGLLVTGGGIGAIRRRR